MMKVQKMVLAMLVLVLAVTGFVTLPLNKTTLLNEGAKKVAQFSWGGSRHGNAHGQEIAAWSWGGSRTGSQGGQTIAGWMWGGSRHGGDSVEIAGLPIGFSRNASQQIAGLPINFKGPQQIAGLPVLFVTKAPPQQIAGLPVAFNPPLGSS